MPSVVGASPVTDEGGVSICVPSPAGRLPADWSQVRIPTGALHMNPDPEALTGLESWFWYTGPTTVSWPSPVHPGRTIDCQVIPAPAPVTYSATLTGWRYEIDDSRPVSAFSDRVGSEEAPAARHVYRTKGTWDAVVRCAWAGSPPAAVALDCGSRRVPVIEVRSVRLESG
jgi:hypothetical protein